MCVFLFPFLVYSTGRGKVAVIKIKATALEQLFNSAAEIVDTIMRDDIGVGQIAFHPTLPKPSSLARQANLRRKLSRPRHPSNLQFELQNQHIALAPGFLRDDVVIDGGRHVLFATDAMMDILARARVWYLDGTFKLIRDPFYQLFSIHSFIRMGTLVKQVPLLFAVMSGKRSVNYTAVLRSVMRMLPKNNVVADYEASIWESIRQVLPNVEIAGCLFHYTQVCDVFYLLFLFLQQRQPCYLNLNALFGVFRLIFLTNNLIFLSYRQSFERCRMSVCRERTANKQQRDFSSDNLWLFQRYQWNMWRLSSDGCDATPEQSPQLQELLTYMDD
ncbi:uncharacterized protein [Antedon mediterranea]|uniref:uncharacterized protein n=1 Tax=Antedon mediterranea TaxID=105859 RepID=UPI003AF9F021